MLAQQQSQRQTLKILPSQIQLLNLYFLNTIELEQRMKNELEENPFMEMKAEEDYEDRDSVLTKDSVQDFQDWEEYGYNDSPDYKSEYQNYFHTEQQPDVAIMSTFHYKDDCKQQLRMLKLSEDELDAAIYIIDVLDNHGFIDKDAEEIADDLSFHLQKMVDPEIIKKALSVVRRLEPLGLGTRDVQEYLVFQLDRMNIRQPDVRCARRLVKNHYNDLMHRQFEKIQHALGIDDEELRIILNLIGTLKFHPVAENTSTMEPKSTIIPDFIITRQGDTIQANLYATKANQVFVNQSLYDQLAQQIGTRQKGAEQYIRGKLASAVWFVNAVKQREDTMMRIMNTIIQMQYDYFLEGDIRLLKPMVLRMVAEKSGLDISTVSRITSNKYAETHFGMLYLKDLFSEGIADKKGEVISSKVIQSVIEEAITGEDKRHPYTDQQLVGILSTKGYNIARRTVAKYREALQIPIAQIRAVWAD